MFLGDHGFACVLHKAAIIIFEGLWLLRCSPTEATYLVYLGDNTRTLMTTALFIFLCSSKEMSTLKRTVMLYSLYNINSCAVCVSPAQHISHLLLVLPLALPPHSLALVPDLASALGLQQLGVV